MVGQKLQYFPFYPDDFFQDENVLLMSDLEICTYLRLLAFQWREGSIPKDMSLLARIALLTVDEMNERWTALSRCFVQNDDCAPDRLVNPRLRKEWLTITNSRGKMSTGGKNSAEKRRLKDLESTLEAPSKHLGTRAYVSVSRSVSVSEGVKEGGMGGEEGGNSRTRKTAPTFSEEVERLYAHACEVFGENGHGLPDQTSHTATEWKKALRSMLAGYTFEGVKEKPASEADLEAALDFVNSDDFWSKTTKSCPGFKRHWPKIRPQMSKRRPAGKRARNISGDHGGENLPF